MKKSIVAACLFASALIAAPAAHAGDVDVGISIGIPGVIWGGPAYYPPPPPRYYYPRPHVVVVPGPAYVRGPVYRHGWRGPGHGNRHWKHHGKHGGHHGHGRH